ncbi:sterol desaturase family protein [Brevundimonas sp.]
MADFIIEAHDWQFALTLGVFVAVALIEQLVSAGRPRADRWPRWAANIVLFAGGFGAVVLVSPWILATATWVQQTLGFPPLAGLGLPAWLLIVLSLLLIDLVGYICHVVSHWVPLLWRMHRTHHSDERFDVSTSIRHHPLESVVSGAVQLSIYAVLGVPLLVVLAYGLAATAWQFLHHMDVRLPEWLDRALRVVVVTPGMHKLHHSLDHAEANSNFGVLFSFWDRLFGTYRRRTPESRATMGIGVTDFPPGRGILGPLLEPFRSR